MFKSYLFLIFLLIGNLAKAQIPLAEVKVNPTYTAWEVLEKARKAIDNNYSYKTNNNYKLFVKTIKNEKDTLLLINTDGKFKILRLSFYHFKPLKNVKAEIIDSVFFNNYQNSYKSLYSSFNFLNYFTISHSIFNQLIRDSIQFKLTLEPRKEEYLINFISDNYKGYWIVNSKNFYLKEIFYENTKLFNFKNTIKDREDAVPYKLIKESGYATNRVLLQFTTTIKNKILLKSFKKYNEFYNYDLNVFINGKFKDQVIFNAFSVFEMDLLE